MFFKYFSRQILFSRTFQDSPVYSSTFQACANPVHGRIQRGGGDRTPLGKSQFICFFINTGTDPPPHLEKQLDPIAPRGRSEYSGSAYFYKF